MLSSGQSGRQPSSKPPLGGQPSSDQFDQNPQNKLSHASFKTYPCKPLSIPPSTMHKQKAAKMSNRESTSSTQIQKHQKFENNDLK
jgi:hypothetical protein